MWDKFKAFPRQSLGNSQAFVNTYCRKVKRDSQYQQQELHDWAVYLEHLQAVFQEFDPAATTKEDIIIRCFLEGLKPSVWAQLDAQGRDLNFWKEAVEKAVNVKAKARLQFFSSTWTWTQGIPKGIGPLQRRRRTPVKRISPPTPPLLIYLVGNRHLPLSRLHPPTQRRTITEALGVEGDKAKNSPATGVNAILKKKEDLLQIEYFHSRKKGHFANRCTQKNKQESRN